MDGKRHYVEGSRRWLKTHSLFSLSLNYSILLTIQITLFFIRSRKLIRDALILLSFFRGDSREGNSLFFASFIGVLAES